MENDSKPLIEQISRITTLTKDGKLNWTGSPDRFTVKYAPKTGSPVILSVVILSVNRNAAIPSSKPGYEFIAEGTNPLKESTVRNSELLPSLEALHGAICADERRRGVDGLKVIE